MNDPDIERLRELAAETQSAAARILAERDRYRSALALIAGLTLSEKPRAVGIAREALNSEAGKR